MTSIDYHQVSRLMKSEITKEKFLADIKVKTENFSNEILQLIENAFEQESEENTEIAIYLMFKFELFDPKYLEALNKLIISDWHEQHENIAMILQKLASPVSAKYLFDTARIEYEYLDYDDSHALAVKCIWALGSIKTKEAIDYLEILAKSPIEVISKNSQEQLEYLGHNI